MARYLVYDVEAENHKSYKRLANQFDKRNWVVALGWKCQGDACCSWSYHPEHDRSVTLHIPDDVTLLVGFNIKYDLLWFWHTPEMRAFFKRGGRIWDCQYAQYLLEGMVEKWQMPSLNDTAPMYGGTKKIDAVKEMWQSGKMTSEIPEDLLLDYLVGTEEEGRNGGDVHNTELVFLGQVRRMRDLGMQKCIPLRMDGLLATTEMEFNGVKVDMVEAETRLAELNAEFDRLTAELNSYVPEFPAGAFEATKPVPLEFNWSSIYHKSYLIYGGALKYRVRVQKLDDDMKPMYTKKSVSAPICGGQPVYPYQHLESPEDGSIVGQDVYLSGKKKGEGKWTTISVAGEPKMEWQERIFDFPGHVRKPDDTFEPLQKESWESTLKDARGNPLYKTGNEALQILGRMDVPFCKVLSNHAALNKEIGTYYVRRDPSTGEETGMLTCVDDEGIIHHFLNHTSTKTGRLSANNPNMQNIPRGDKSKIKAMFISRFGEDGLMLEADYSQLEVVVQGVLSGDKNLCEDLRNRIDFHCKRVALKYAMTYEQATDWCKNEDSPYYAEWKPKRTACKVFSFQRAYGAGAKTIAACTGMSIEDVNDMIAKEAAEYPGVDRFNELVAKSVQQSSVAFRDPQRGFRVFRRGTWQSPTGTIYSWRSWDAPAHLKKRGQDDAFSPPEMKNYPVQGTGGEFVEGILGKIWRRFVETDNYGGKALFVNTVHDCVWIDMHRSVAKQVIADVKRIMESIPELYNGLFPELNITVPFPVDVEIGKNMMELTHPEHILAEAS